MSFVQSLLDLSVRVWPPLVDHLWQSTLFAGLAAVAVLLLRSGPARARHTLWLMASAKLALPAFALLGLAGAAGLDRTAMAVSFGGSPPFDGISRTMDRVAAPFTAPSAVAATAPARDPRPSSSVLASGLLTLAWASGCAVVAACWWRRRLSVSRAVAAGRRIEAGRERAALDRARARARWRGPVPLVVSPLIQQPGALGIRRPIVLLPQGIADRLSDEELEIVLLHELVHVRRRDNLIGHLHMILCWLFWFYPVVWLIDRRLLVERERACDDEVLGLSKAPGVYASSLLKVSLFCIGPRVAGVSAAGSFLRQRLAGIAAHRHVARLSGWHRTLLAASAVSLLLFFAAGLLGAGPGVSLAASSDAPTPAPPGSRSGTPRAHDAPALADIEARVDAAPPTAISFDNAPGAPVRILRATVRIVPLDRPGESADGTDVLVTGPALDLESGSPRQVAFVRVGFGSERRIHDVVGFDVALDAGGSHHLQPDWRTWWNAVPADDIGELVARIVGVRFADGDTWGKVTLERGPAPTPTPTPVASDAAGMEAKGIDALDTVVSYPARFENPEGAPVIIVEARTGAGARDARGETSLPVVTLTNTTDRRIVGLKLRFKAGTAAHAVSAFTADIAPRGTYTYRTATTLDGDPARMHVQLLGVRFDNDDIWGEFDTTIDTRLPTVSVPQYIRRPDREPDL